MLLTTFYQDQVFQNCNASSPLVINGQLSTKNCIDSFGETFFQWAHQIKLPKIDPSVSSWNKNHSVILDYNTLEPYKLAKVFYTRAQGRPVDSDLRLMISHLLERGPYLTKLTSLEMRSILQTYQLKNRGQESEALTLSRVAQLFPWWVWHHLEVRSNETQTPPECVRLLGDQCFASLVPRDSAYDLVLEAHIKGRLAMRRLEDGATEDGSSMDDFHRQLRKLTNQARFGSYLTDSQRLLLLRQLETLTNKMILKSIK